MASHTVRGSMESAGEASCLPASGPFTQSSSRPYVGLLAGWTGLRNFSGVRKAPGLHGHRGARGLRPENTLPGFARALEIGVDSLELDVALTADGAVVATHDLVVSAVKCRDTAPETPGDPLFPYTGQPVYRLTLAQLKTLDCGVRRPGDFDSDPFLPTQLPIPGSPMPTLDEVIELVHRYGADTVRLTVELKSDPTRPDLTADPDVFTARVCEVLAEYGMTTRATLQSFDWRIVDAAARYAPQSARAALVENETLGPGSPWLAGLDLAGFGGDVAAAAAEIGATTFSPEHVLVTDELLDRAARHGLPVVVWTVNEEADMRRLIDTGVAGIITDYPDRLRTVMEGHGLPLPAAYPKPGLVNA